MAFNATYISYKETGAFSRIVTDYLDHASVLRPFYGQEPDLDGIRKNIALRKARPVNRKLLVEELQKQYASLKTSDVVKANIEALSDENTFTVCTAHQPNIFTGHLYFIYKILHAVKLAGTLNRELPGNRFVPVYYMGSEDADLQELGEVTVNGKKYEWLTGQKGAVGRMKIDKAFETLISEIGNQLSVEKHGDEIMSLVKMTYTPGKTIEQATFDFVNSLFADFGLIVLLPDNELLKAEFAGVVRRELETKFSAKLLNETIASFPPGYKVQVEGREINLFYLKDDIRERIVDKDDGFAIMNTALVFSRQEMLKEINDHPGRFSPNVILRPVFQEMIMPGVAFIGGGGELAYWLELKKIFDEVNVPFPVLLLRNSFLVVPQSEHIRIKAMQFKPADLFEPMQHLFNRLVKQESELQLSLDTEKEALANIYGNMRQAAGKADTTLMRHVEALEKQAMRKVENLEKKMLRAEKRKFGARQRHLQKTKDVLFPNGSLQERVDNLLPFYAVWGSSFIRELLEHSLDLQQQFCILEDTGK